METKEIKSQNLNYVCHSRYCTPCDEYQDDNKFSKIPDYASRQNNYNTAYCALKLINHHPLAPITKKVTVDTRKIRKFPSLATAACLDTGNLFGSCLSKKAAESLQVDIVPVKQKSVGLASSQARMKILGRARYPLEARFGSHTTYLRPFVLESLACPVNLSLYFLQIERAVIHFDKMKMTLDHDPVQLGTPGQALEWARLMKNRKVKVQVPIEAATHVQQVSTEAPSQGEPSLGAGRGWGWLEEGGTGGPQDMWDMLDFAKRARDRHQQKNPGQPIPKEVQGLVDTLEKSLHDLLQRAMDLKVEDEAGDDKLDKDHQEGLVKNLKLDKDHQEGLVKNLTCNCDNPVQERGRLSCRMCDRSAGLLRRRSSGPRPRPRQEEVASTPAPAQEEDSDDRRTEEERADGRFKAYHATGGMVSLRPLEQRTINIVIPRLPKNTDRVLIESALPTAIHAIPAAIYKCGNGKATVLISNWDPDRKLKIAPGQLLAAATPVVDEFTDTPYLQAMTTTMVSATEACAQKTDRDYDPEVIEMLSQLPSPDISSMTRDDLDINKDNPQLRKELEAFSQQQLDAWLEEQFQFAKSPYLSEDPKLKRQVLDVLSEYTDVLSVSKTEYGRTNVLMAHLRLKDPYCNPFRGKSRPLNPQQEESLKEQIDTWMKEGVIQPSESPWNAPIVPALKKNGDWRWCLNYQNLNDKVEKDAHPLSNIMTNIHKLSGSSCFSVVDGTGAYHNISLTPPSRQLTAFGYSGGHYEFVRLPFGLSSAPAIYSRLVETVLAWLPPEVRKTTLPYLDDLLIHTRTPQQHVHSLAALLDVHRRARMMVSPSKSSIFRKECEYLGHLVSEKGYSMVPDYVDQIRRWPRPTNASEVRSYLGKLSYYRTFIKKYSELAHPLERLRSEQVDFVWGDKEEKAFQDLKEAFYAAEKAGPLGYPDFSKDGGKFILDTDWSKLGISAELSQVDKDGNTRVIAMAAKKCSPGESNYSPSKGEFFAGYAGMLKFEHLLRFKKFVWRTDCQAHATTIDPRAMTGRFKRMQDVMATFDYDIEWRKGQSHANVDIPSRAHHIPDYTPADEEEANTYMFNLGQEEDTSDWGWDDGWDCGPLAPEDEHHGPDGSEPPAAASVADIVRQQEEDRVLSKVRHWVKESIYPTKREVRKMERRFHYYRSILGELVFKENILYRREQLVEGDHRLQLCVPDTLRDRIFEIGHEHRSAGHPGLRRTIERIRQNFFWPYMISDITTKLEVCGVCQRKRPKPPPQRQFQADMRVGNPHTKISLDLIGPLIASGQDDNKYILTILDNFTRFFVAVPIPDKNASTVAKAFLDHYLSKFGPPLSVLTDNGKEFSNRLLREVLTLLDIQHLFAPPYSPRGNRVERHHQMLTSVLKALVDMRDNSWSECVPWACLALNTSVSSVTGRTPYSLEFGRECHLPVDLVATVPKEEKEISTGFAGKLEGRLRLIYQKARHNVRLAFRRAARLYQSPYAGRQFSERDRVWYFCPARKKEERARSGAKFLGGWLGPFIIHKKISEILYIIRPAPGFATKGNDNTIPVVVDRLAHYREPDGELAGPPIELDLRQIVDDADPNLEVITPEDANCTPLPLKVKMRLAGWDLAEKLDAEVASPAETSSAHSDPGPAGVRLAEDGQRQEDGQGQEESNRDMSQDGEGDGALDQSIREHNLEQPPTMPAVFLEDEFEFQDDDQHQPEPPDVVLPSTPPTHRFSLRPRVKRSYAESPSAGSGRDKRGKHK